MAGAYIGDSVRGGTLTLDAGDLDEFRDGLLAVGDDPGQPWFAEGSHGTAEQRTDCVLPRATRSPWTPATWAEDQVTSGRYGDGRSGRAGRIARRPPVTARRTH